MSPEMDRQWYSLNLKGSVLDKHQRRHALVVIRSERSCWTQVMNCGCADLKTKKKTKGTIKTARLLEGEIDISTMECH